MKRWIALFLSLTMLLSLCPVNIWAEELTAKDQQVYIAEDSSADDLSGDDSAVESESQTEDEQNSTDDEVVVEDSSASAPSEEEEMPSESKDEAAENDEMEFGFESITVSTPIANAATHSHPLCGSSCTCSESHSSLNWIAWDGTTRMYSNSNYYLTKDVVLDNTIILDYGYSSSLCLNGYSITCEDRVFDIYSYRSLWITDCKGTGKIETTGNDCTIGNNRYLSIWGGTILNSGSSGAAIEAYRGTTTFVCGGRVESNGYTAIDAMAGSTINIQGGTVYGSDYLAIDSAGSDSYTSKLTISGGTISGEHPYSVVNWIGGNFTMTGGIINGDVDVVNEKSVVAVSGGNINGEMYVYSKDLSITGGQMELYTIAEKTSVSAGTFKETCRIGGSDATISAGNFSDCDLVNITAPTWICGGVFDKITVNDQPLYLSGVPRIEVLEITRPNVVSAQNKENSGSYGGDPVQIHLSGTWSSGDVVVRNVTSDTAAQKFVLAGETWQYLERSGNNLVLRSLPGGQCGDSATWLLQNGILTISGTGAIAYHHSGREYPWGDYVDEINQIVVESGITSIPNYAFEYCENVTSIALPDTLTSLSLSAFNDCGNLNNLILPANAVIDPYRNQFIRCESLSDLYFMGTSKEWEIKTGVTDVSSVNSNMTVHFLQYHPGTADCVTAGTEGYYQFDDTTVYAGFYNEDKQPISQPGTVPAYGHRVIVQQATSAEPITVSNSGAVPFTLTNGVYYSANKDHSSSSEVRITAQQACSLTVRYGVSSEARYDKLQVLYNDTEYSVISGSVSDQAATLTLSAGDVVAVRYTKDSSVSNGQDQGWFSLEYDQVEVFVDAEVSADTVDASCTTPVICDFCGEIVKPALGHRTMQEQTIMVDPISVENTGTYPFSLQNGTYYSTNKSNSSTSELRFVAQYPCSLTLKYGVSSERNYDKLTILLNTTQKVSVSGSYTDCSVSITMAQGDIVKVRYTKDSSASSGQDRGWVTPIYTQVATTGNVEVLIDPTTLGCAETVACDYCQEQFQGEGNHTFVDGVCSGCGATTGYCGDTRVNDGKDVIWVLDDGLMTIFGTGDMDDYAYVSKIYGIIAGIDYIMSRDWTSRNITKAVICEGVTSVGGGSFHGANYWTSALEEISLPDSLKYIGDCAFEECDRLQEITIPENVTSIREYAFKGCSNLSTITFVGDAPSRIEADAFNGVTATCYYPNNSTWTEEVRQDYGGALTWVPYGACLEGHTWVDATCEAPKNCTVCGETEGEPLGHTEVIDEAVAPTCTETGLTEGKHCSVCDAVLVEQEVVAKKGHTEVIDGAVAPTCTETGLTEGKHCSVCDAILVEQEVVAKNGHTEVIDEGVAPTCTETGLTEGKHCSVCDAVLVKQEVVVAKGHSYKSVVIAPTCTEQGYTTHTCTVCDDSYEDNYVDATGHSYSAWSVTTAPTCTEKGIERRDCQNCDHFETQEIAAKGHTEVIDEAVAPTCTETGLTEGKHCSVCDTVLVKQEVVAAKGHSYKSVVTAPTCTEQGYTTHTCTVCGNSYVDSYVNAKGHSYDAWTVITAPTCTEQGTERRDCQNCDHFETRDIAVKGHTEVIDEAVAPTCTETGLTEGKHCSVCDTVLVKQEVVAAKGHSYKSVVTAPTCTEQGYTTHTCTVCGDSYVDNYVVATGHSYRAWSVTTAPTCTEQGVERRDCQNCDHFETRTVAAKGHTEVIDEAVTPTCTETGLTEGKHCSVCDAVLVEQEVVAANGHSYDAFVPVEDVPESGHYQSCSCGEETALERHEYGDDRICDICTYTLAPLRCDTVLPQTYTGEAITPAVKVYYGEKLLELDKDYTVNYSNNVNVPAEDAEESELPTITIHGKGYYIDTLSVTFTIAKATPALGNVSVVGTVKDTTNPTEVVLTGTNTTVDGTFALTDEKLLANVTTYHWTFTPTDTANYNVVTGEVEIDVLDTVAPAVVITVEENQWRTTLNTITFGLFFKETKTVTIEYADNENGSGIDAMLYYVSDKAVADVANIPWETYSKSFNIDPDGTFVIYAKAVDKDGNSAMVNSDGLVVDATAPLLKDIVDGGIYYGDLAITASDALAGVKTVTVDGDAVVLENGQYTIAADNSEHTVVVTDKAGNTQQYTVNVMKMYTVSFIVDGEILDTVTVGHGQSIGLPMIPDKTGYDQFPPYWNHNGKNITKDTEITAIYIINKYTVSGTVTSYLEADETVTIGLYVDDSTVAKYATVVTGNTVAYAIANVDFGTYTMKVSKENHVTREYTVVVDDHVTWNAEICPKGDVNLDGEVNADDLTALARHVAKIESLTDPYALLTANVDNNNMLSADDLTLLARFVAKIIPSL